MDESAGKLKRLESKLSEVNLDIENLEKTTDVETLRGNIKKYSNDRNKLEDDLSEIEEKVKELQKHSSLATELEVQLELKSNKDSQYRR